jgi:hypothetical protein
MSNFGNARTNDEQCEASEHLHYFPHVLVSPDQWNLSEHFSLGLLILYAEMRADNPTSSIYEQLEAATDRQSLLNSAVDNLSDSCPCFKSILKSMLNFDLSEPKSDRTLLKQFVSCTLSFILPERSVARKMRKTKLLDKHGEKLKRGFKYLFVYISRSMQEQSSLNSTNRSDNTQYLPQQNTDEPFVNAEHFNYLYNFDIVNKELLNKHASEIKETAIDRTASEDKISGLNGLNTLPSFNFNRYRDIGEKIEKVKRERVESDDYECVKKGKYLIN